MVTWASACTFVMMALDDNTAYATSHSLGLATYLSAVDDTLHTLDSNRDGVISKSEIGSYAQGQGIAVQDILGDFSSIDANGDGSLDATEISKALDESETEQASRQAAAKVAAVAAPMVSAAPKSLVASLTANAQQAFPAVAEADSSKHEKEDGLLELDALQQSAERQASSIMATSMASRVQQLLKQSAVDKASAETYQKRAMSLRGSAAKLMQTALQDTKRVAMESTAKVTNASMPQFHQLEADEQDAKKKAVEHRKLAHQAMENVMQAQAVLAKPLQITGA